MNQALRDELMQMVEIVDERRATLGLPTIAAQRASAPTEEKFSPEAARRLAEQELAWRRAVGWIE